MLATNARIAKMSSRERNRNVKLAAQRSKPGCDCTCSKPDSAWPPESERSAGANPPSVGRANWIGKSSIALWTRRDRRRRAFFAGKVEIEGGLIERRHGE